MPWLRVVWKVGSLRLMKDHAGAFFLQWGGGRMVHMPRLPRLIRRRRRRAGA